MYKTFLTTFTLFVTFAVLSCSRHAEKPLTEPLVGAWRATVHFTSGAFSNINDLEFMYSFNAGGTMTESSNYDALPPVPPAYGVWKSIADHQYVAHYEFYTTRPPDSSDHAPVNFGWLPAGRGALTDSITVAPDGLSFSSKIHLELFDSAGKPLDGGGEASVQAALIHF